jgi:hypothetical protein
MVNSEDYSLYLIQNQEYPSDSEDSDNNEFNNNIIITRKKRKEYYLDLDEWVTLYSDDLYYIWNRIKEYTTHNVPILDKIDYSDFVSLCFKNSSKQKI